jgi:hypothetical protein
VAKLKLIATLALSLIVCTGVLAQEPAPVGHPASPFTARDQFGKERTLESLMGPKGVVLVFFRSADW